MSVSQVTNEKGLIAGRLLDTAAFPLSGYFQNPATANLNMATNSITNAADVATGSISHPTIIGAIGVNNTLEIADNRRVFFLGPTQGRVAMDPVNDLALGLASKAEVVVEGLAENVKVNVAAGGVAGEFLVGGTPAGALAGAAGYIGLGDTQDRTAGAAAGTFVMAKDLAAPINITNYLPITLNGVPYWIPLCPSDPQTT